MRISELSSRSGTPVASIKYYLREGLLASGRKSSANQAEYGDEHIARLRLIRSLLNVGGLSVATAREVLAVIDDEEVPWGMAIGVAANALPSGQRESSANDAEHGPGLARLADAIAARGWVVDPLNAGWAPAARVLDAYADLGFADLDALLGRYIDAIEAIARADMDAVAQAPSRADMTEIVVVGTVLGDALAAGIRRLAHEHISRQMFPLPSGLNASGQPASDQATSTAQSKGTP